MAEAQAAFDYVIVGAGSAGCVLAERLSADPANRVLLLEEGGDHSDMLVTMPKGFGKLLTMPDRAHYYATTNQREGGGGPEIWVRGKMLGGSSAVNGMVWNRGQQEDYDRLAELAGPQWSWDAMLPHLRGLEDHAMGASATRGTGGPVAVKTHPAPTPLAKAWISAGTELGLPAKEDHSGLAQEGIGPLQWNIDARGRRVSSARAFLDRARRRPNLHVATGVRVDRVTLDSGRATGVEGRRGGEAVRFVTRGEVILAAGALMSPRILQLSGIGPAEALRAAGIPVILDSPSVGRHMREHILLSLNFRLRHWRDSSNREFSGARLLGNVARHVLLGSGTLSYGSSEAAAFARVLPESTRPDTQIMFQPYSTERSTGGFKFEDAPGMSLYSFRLRPESEGSITVTSPDPDGPATIDPNYLSAESDRRAVIGAVRFLRKIIAQPALEPFVVGETEATASMQSDDEILDAYRLWGASGLHATATVRMGRDNSSPLDGELRLRGIEALRVVDCSVFPEMIAGNTNAPTMALASRAAELILAR
ncbi:GMC oxidoreductase [Novosphingobium sp. ERN07]|uniref:GMC family oxidoreductase n=1 Tax=Novosphingobium sp. ERN07 TaxID=2726187 RepID=UPI00145633C4|nr:GMC family oxidoreductase N-terminal domain-containing protein [Novosphingobium sp. ERN07]NLR72794.1 GMC oxidoreductase [Novosphingobium sp. ERN07]